MKNLILKIKAFLIVFMLIMPLALFATAIAQVDVPVDETNWVVVIIGIGIVIIEIIARYYPDQKITGLIGLIINILKSISDYFNRGDKD